MSMKIAVLDILGVLARKKIGFIELDAVVGETITFNNTVTSAPIESGESITDHVFNQPLELSLECIISEADIVRQFTDSAAPKARIEAYESLKDLWRSKAPVEVVAGYETYTNMLVGNITIPRTNADGNSIRFNVSLVQATILDSALSSSKRKRAKKGRKQGVIANNSIEAVAKRIKERLVP